MRRCGIFISLLQYFRYNLTTNSHDIALIKLVKRAPMFRVAELCSEPVEYGTEVGACGLGSTPARHPSPSASLHEIFLRGIFFSFASFFEIDFCPDDQVCTEPITDGASICNLDEGSPLYKLQCHSRAAECILGIASHFVASEHPEINCSGGSNFASVPHHYEWISETIAFDFLFNSGHLDRSF